jgi:hypothetical protein
MDIDFPWWFIIILILPFIPYILILFETLIIALYISFRKWHRTHHKNYKS